jgi:hypothetical protein
VAAISDANTDDPRPVCEYVPCGQRVAQTPGKRRRRFCCDAHRVAAWQFAHSGRAPKAAARGGGPPTVEDLREGLTALHEQANQLVRALLGEAATRDDVHVAKSRETEAAQLRQRCAQLQRRVFELELHLESARREVAFVREQELPQRVQQAITRYQQEERDRRPAPFKTRSAAKRKRSNSQNSKKT